MAQSVEVAASRASIFPPSQAYRRDAFQLTVHVDRLTAHQHPGLAAALWLAVDAGLDQAGFDAHLFVRVVPRDGIGYGLDVASPVGVEDCGRACADLLERTMDRIEELAAEALTSIACGGLSSDAVVAHALAIPGQVE